MFFDSVVPAPVALEAVDTELLAEVCLCFCPALSALFEWGG
jgi:hypothetical protein